MPLKALILGLLLSSQCISLAKSADTLIHRNTLSLSIFANGFPVGMSYQRILSNKDVAEIGLGLGYLAFPERPSFGLGYKRYFKEIKSDKIIWYSGFTASDLYSPLDTPGPFLTVPIGISYFKKKLYLDLNIGPTTLPNESWIIAFYGGLNVGFSF